MNSTGRGSKHRLISGTLLVLVSLAGLASILASDGGGGGGYKAPAVNYSLLPTTLLGMSTSSADTSITDGALEAALVETDLSDIGDLLESVISPFFFPPYSNERCPDGGRSTLAINLATPGMLSVGDSYTVSFTRCIFTDLTFDGSLTVSVISVGSLNDPLPPEQQFIGAALQLEYNNSAISTPSEYEVTDGDMTLSGDNTLGYVRYIMAGTSLAEASNLHTTHLADYTLWAGTDAAGTTHFSADYRLASTLLGGIIQVDTPTPYELLSGDLNPSIGVAMVTGAAGNGVKASAISNTQVRLDYEFSGDGLFDDFTIVRNWNDVAALSSPASGFTQRSLPPAEFPPLIR